MTKIREHRGSLSDAMETVFEVEDFAGLVEHMKRSLQPFGMIVVPEKVKVEQYAWDGRIGWDTYIVTLTGYGVWGFTNGPLRQTGEDG